MSSARRILNLLSVLLLWASSSGAAPAVGTVRGQVLWQGDVSLSEVVRVEPSAELTIAAGTTIRPLSADAKLIVAGRLRVLGRPKSPVVFESGDSGWLGIEFVSGAQESLIEHAFFDKAQVAISSSASYFTVRNCTFRAGGTAINLLRDAHPLIEDNLFSNNRTAINSEMKSIAIIRRNRFADHATTAILLAHNSNGAVEGNTFENNKQAIGVMQQYPGLITRNRFVGNDVGIYCTQTQDTPQIRYNRFEANRQALTNISFAAPLVEDNTFVRNETAIHNDQFGSPKVRRNLFMDNQVAIYANRKSSPLLEKNRIESNGVAIFCDYSSYPSAHYNNFRANRMGVKLGTYQSGEWEKVHGAAVATQMATHAAGGRNRPAAAEKIVRDMIDVSQNWWDADTAALGAAGVDGNLEMFYDRRDQPRVYYEGYDANGYLFDVVRFDPWLSSPVVDSGPKE